MKEASENKTSELLIPFVGLFRTFAVALISPYLGLALYRKGLPLPYVGIVYVMLAVIGALGQLFGGAASDKLGRRKVMVFSQIGSGFALVLMGMSFLISGYFVFIVMSLFQNFFGSSNMAAFNAYVGELGSDQNGMIRGYSRMRIGINVGWATGPLIGGVLIGYLGFKNTWIISGLIVLASSVLFLFLKAKQRFYSNLDISTFKDLDYLKKISPFVLIYAFIAQFGLTLTIYETVNMNVPVSLYGLIYLLNGAIVAVFQMPMAKMLYSKNIVRWIEYGIIFYIVGFFVYAFGGLIYALLGTCITTLGENIVSPLSMTFANLLSKEEKRGSYLGVFGMLSSSSRSLGSLYGSFLLSKLTNPFEIWSSADLLGALSIVYFSLINRSKRSF
ncbi:MAG: MFS transporter [Nitrososphaeria archaeon]